ncbi:hypothetical protein [Thermithiobacillus plumbiphilus]|uniref:MnmC-like methyltransferase domain-containing protein n=1 Tax=Thermithiobacillus plumbiphilus TaxID=1729899 RepID=A0ABU9DBN4_9PROT
MELDWIPTEDGTFTLRHASGETYNDPEGAVHTAFSAFAYGGGLLSAGERVRVLDIGFGLGLNATAAWATLRQIGAEMDLVAIEPDQEILDVFDAWPAPFSVREPREALGKALHGQQIKDLSVRMIRLPLDEALEQARAGYHAIFLDPWSAAVQPEMWEPARLEGLLERLLPGRSMVFRSYGDETFDALQAAGLPVERLDWPAGHGHSFRIQRSK